MASNKAAAVAVALLCFVLLSAAVDAYFVSYGDVDNSCFCGCMIERCMSTPGATREVCAPACDDGCHRAGLQGRVDADDFCGY